MWLKLAEYINKQHFGSYFVVVAQKRWGGDILKLVGWEIVQGKAIPAVSVRWESSWDVHMGSLNSYKFLIKSIINRFIILYVTKKTTHSPTKISLSKTSILNNYIYLPRIDICNSRVTFKYQQTYTRSDWRDTRGKWPFARNPEKSWWHRHTSLKRFWPQPSWLHGQHGLYELISCVS